MVLSALADDGAVDRKGQRLIVDRFRAHHRQRASRLRAALEPGQRAFFDALPLLIHVNHAALPGFVDHQVPAGIDRYTPDEPTLAAGRELALSYAPDRLIERTRYVQAVLFAPDDAPGGAHRLWVCCAEANHSALQSKLAAISEHARRIGMKLTGTPVDPLAVRARAVKLGATPTLALDRFYTNALWTAGRYPLWWLVPTAEQRGYTDYATRLRERRFVAADETFDFGPIATVPADEWLDASLELLERAQVEPFSALPWLQLIEARTSERNNEPGLLAHAYKGAVHRDVQAAPGPELDPTRIVRDQVERYLVETGEQTRLGYAAHLHSYGAFRPDASWSLAKRIEEHKSLEAELERALTVAASLYERATRDGDPRDDARLQRVRRQIASARTTADTIPTLHDSLLLNQAASPVEVVRTDERWHVLEAGRTLFVSRRLAPIGAWLHWHRVAPERLHVDDAATRARLVDLVRRLRLLNPNGSLVLVLNAEHEPLHERLAETEALVSAWDDPLDYSGYHQNLVVSADRIDAARSVTCAGDDGTPGLTQALEQALRREFDKVDVVCAGAVQHHAIEVRLQALLAELRSTFHGDSAAGRFVFANGAGFTLVTKDEGSLEFASSQDEAVLHALLRAPLPARRPVTRADSRSRRLGWLRRLAEVVEVGRATLLIVEDDAAKGVGVYEHVLYLSDHEGAIHRFVIPGRTIEQLARELDAFFARQRLTGVAAPRLYASTPNGLIELRIPPGKLTPQVALRVRRESGRVDIHHGERRWTNVPVSEAVLDELIASLVASGGAGRATPTPTVGEVAFEAETPRLAELLALKLGFERRLRERMRS